MKFTFEVIYYDDEDMLWGKAKIKKINARTAEEAEAKFRKRFPDKYFGFVDTYKDPFTFLNYFD